MRPGKWFFLLILLGISFGLKLASSFLNKDLLKKDFHTPEEKITLNNLMQSPIDSGEYFLHSIRCKGCHGFDTLGIANLDANGNDVNLFDDWEGTMMANSARDPLWRAKVSHEILVNPAHSNGLQTKCTSCHAPMGHFTKIYHGNQYYTIADLENDSLGLDGVSCVGCHAIGTNGLGSRFSGDIPYDTNHVEYGPFLNPLIGPMQLYVGLIPTHSNHVSESRMCSSCHTLLTNSVDLAGNYTGRKFVEQATFHEWLNSGAAADNVTCQSCHMPQIQDSVIIANQYMNLPPRSPFNKHKFQGGNAFMIKLIKNNKSKLGITALDTRFDSALVATNRNLRQNTADVSIFLDSLTLDTAFVKVRLFNKAGHKFPSGYPSRRAVLQVVAVGGVNDTLFQSGTFDSNYEVKNIAAPFEVHHRIINSSQRSQIYEMVMGDVNANKTTVLERADTILKDNRLPPEGFFTSSPVYDTVAIIGEAATDSDFNRYPNNSEGSGADLVYYRISVTAYNQPIRVYARLLYQTVPPGWLTEMFSYSSAPIDSFKNMYYNADRIPDLIDSDSLMSFTVGSKEADFANELVVSPQPSDNGRVTMHFPKSFSGGLVSIYSVNGQLIQQHQLAPQTPQLPLQLPESKGVYLAVIRTEDGLVLSKKILR